ncbi:thioredoxin domain-containing protein [Desulfofustis glycolicus]|uniref:Spermatogenesis-associated protein 20-like TRX domain-containing protein n=1 Tax=Desulfofustis glycolicus DSM 9705 TaxID=1121409 RepID=A0A1M5YJ07_9BACT|nr:thioredoxin domain-containing protein [Desulfofustis glycolicus]MCB2218582.1 thioredoxin domain-containing protein [Desulfobulbaceae bacterium]SHI11924.1 hypothetical protein SAMN02745124_04086 [Desulfofustis glycolicus DSM 9705]
MVTNRLVHEKSPYLLQHAHNPVDWYPWGDEAFRKAEEEDKPIFLSVGYATCHWCHVMEKESFEDEEAARHLNETFVCIKVDREERADIDSVYMAACQLLTGRGGWPLTVFLGPDKKPFFAGTYIPKTSDIGRTGLVDICRQVKTIWENDRQRLIATADEIAGHVGTAFQFAPADEQLGAGILDATCEELAGAFDERYGGFGGAPKFPTPHRMIFLLKYHQRMGDEKALLMVEKTLQAMRLGGIWDHVGFGFHRYSTDTFWLLPHFEKMLYDQALVAMAYLEAYRLTKNPLYASTAEEIFTYVLRDMTSEAGGFYTAEDADSEGEEGKFYVWTAREFKELLGDEQGDLWLRLLNISPDGNFADEATGRRTGVNIPHLTRPLARWAEDLDMEEAELAEQWEKTRATLFQARKQRVPPLKDDKILTDWNGLMIAALAKGARILGNDLYAEASRRAASFITRHLTDESGGLLHRFRDRQAGIAATANDYAFYVHGLLELFRATAEPDFLSTAVNVQEQMIERFWDREHGGFYLTADTAEKLPARPKELYDGATPSANSVAFSNLLHLSRLTGEAKWQDTAGKLNRLFAGTVTRSPSAFAQFMIGLECSVEQLGTDLTI